MNEIVVPVKKAQLYALAGLFTAAFVASTAIMLNLELIMMAQLRLTALIVAFLGSVICGYAAFYFWMRAIQGPPIIQVGAEGIRFDISVFNQGKVEWEWVKEYAMVRSAGQNYLLVFLHNPELLIETRLSLGRMRLRSNLKRFRTPVAIPAGWVDGDPGEVLKGIAEFGKGMKKAGS